MPACRILCVIAAGLAAMLHTRPAHSQPPQAPQPLPSDTSGVKVVTPAPAVSFAHDRFFLGFVSRFATGSLSLDGDHPGRIGLEEDRLSAFLPGVGFRRNGVPYQDGEYHWLGGDGASIGFRADRWEWGAEALAYPPTAAGEPLLLPGPQDSVFVMGTPLLGFTPAEVSLWRDPEVPDSAEAVARYTNGPNGFSYAGGRFRGRIGGGWEFDGQVYRVFSDGNQENAGYDGHNLDVEFRRRLGHLPMRVRFRQTRGTRSLVFRWDEGFDRAEHLALLAHLDAELAVPGGKSEWLIGYQLRHEDQRKKAPSLLVGEQKWFDRRHRISLSHLWTGHVSAWARLSGIYRESSPQTGMPDAWIGDADGGLWLAPGRFDLSATGGLRMEKDQRLDYRVAAAVSVAFSPQSRLVLSIGRSLQTPSTLSRFLPLSTGPGAYAEAGDPGLPQATRDAASLALRHRGQTLQIQLVLAGGRDRDQTAWQPAGDTADRSMIYTAIAQDRDFAGAGVNVVWNVSRWLELSGSIDHLLVNEWVSGGAPVFAPKDAWSARLRVPLRFLSGKLLVSPVVWTMGAHGGSLPEEWAILSAGADATLKLLTFFYYRENLLDRVYYAGGVAPSYGQYTRFGFRWTFWN